MNKLTNELKKRGCDTEGALERFLNKEELYVKCYKKFLNDPSFAALGDALSKKDAQLAFRAAHTLKGVTENMGLTPFTEIVVKIVEPLRAEKLSAEVTAAYDELMNELEKYRRIGDESGI